MKATYDAIGLNYAEPRKPDPRIAAIIAEALGPADRSKSFIGASLMPARVWLDSRTMDHDIQDASGVTFGLYLKTRSLILLCYNILYPSR